MSGVMPQRPRQRGRFRMLLLCGLLGACTYDSAEQAADITQSLCQKNHNGVNWEALLSENCTDLADYHLFTDAENPRQNPTAPGLAYQLNSALFSDFAQKYRYLFIPPGSQAEYQSQEIIEFPTGTVLVKVFALPQSDNSDALMEIRLLILRSRGWTGLTYRWQAEQQNAVLDLNGENIQTQVWHDGYFENFTYVIPTAGTCKTCHQFNSGDTSHMIPIGPKVRLLNRTIQTSAGTENQLLYWQNLGLLNHLPADTSTLEFAPDWHNANYSLQQRAKAYLDINCSHCHRDEGAASLSGLRLEYWRDMSYQHGLCNPAHGWRGGGYDIWPGNGSISSLPLRMELTAPTDRMPPIGRTLTDQNAVDLMRSWIDTLQGTPCE